MSVILKKDFVPTYGEINGKSFGYFTESAGYRSSKSQIEGFLKAGQSLEAYRAGEYDSDEEDPVDDPSLDVRDMELSEIGSLMNKTDEALTASEEKAQAIMEEAKTSEPKASEPKASEPKASEDEKKSV